MILLMATLGVGLSTAVVGFGFSWITGMPLLVALVFGALISPTDPVAVMGVLREAELQKTLETKIAGESLFNDGVGYVAYLVLDGLGFPSNGHQAEGLGGAVGHFLQEALGGAVLGVVLGWLVFQVMKWIDDYALEVSAAIMAVCAGLLIGDKGTKCGMSEQTRRYIDAYWRLIDNILNAVLFLLIGIEVFSIVLEWDFLLAGALSVGLALVARLVAVAVPVAVLRPFQRFSPGIIPIMKRGGLKGGISVALALALPESEWKPPILTATYVVVVFSIIVQGLTIEIGRAHV